MAEIEGLEEDQMINKPAGRMKILNNPLFSKEESQRGSLSEETREGPLQLLRKGKFRDRYVIVTSNNMYVYKKRDRKILKSQWNLGGCSLQRLPAQKHRMSGQRLDFRFDITMAVGDTLNFAAATDSERRDWCEYLERLGESDAQRQAVHENSIIHSVIPGVGDVSISCDVFKASANLGFLRCGLCGVRQSLHFSPADVNIELPVAEYAGWLNIRKRHRTNFLVSENKRRYMRLKGFQLSWSHDPKITDANVSVYLDLRCQLMQYDKKSRMFSSSFDFSLKTATDKYSFSVSTEDERNLWMDKIHKLLVIAYQIQEARITYMASTIAGMEASHVFDATELWKQRQVLQVLEERARPFPVISQETDSQTEKIYQSAAKLANGEDSDIIEFIQKDGVAKLSNTLRRLGNQDHLSEDEVDLVAGVIQCFRAIMNKPVGMEAIILDTTPIVLLSRIVFLSQTTPDASLLMSVCGILSATSIFSMDGYDLVIRTLRTMDRAFHRLLDRGEVHWNDFCIVEEVPRLRPFVAIIKLLEHLGLQVQAVIVLLALINTVITSPNTRHERLRIRAELFSQGLDQALHELAFRADQTIRGLTGSKSLITTVLNADTPPVSEASDDSAGSATAAKPTHVKKLTQTQSTMDFLMSRRMGEGSGMSAGFGTTEAGTVVQDGQAVMKSEKAPNVDAKQRFQRLHETLNKSFEIEDVSHSANPKVKGRTNVPESNLLSIGGHPQPSANSGQPVMRNLVQEEVELWEQVKHLIEMYKELGEEDTIQDEVEYDGGNLTHVLFAIDRISLQRKMEIREQAVLVMNQLLLGLKDTDIEDQLLKVEGFTFKGIKFSNEMNAAKFHMRKQLEDRGIRAFESKLGDTALQRARRQAENFSDKAKDVLLADEDSAGGKTSHVQLLQTETRAEPPKSMMAMVQSSLATQQPVVPQAKPRETGLSMPPLPPAIPNAAKAIPLAKNAPNLAAALSSAASTPSKPAAVSESLPATTTEAKASTSMDSAVSATGELAVASLPSSGPPIPPAMMPSMPPMMPRGPRGLPPPKAGALGNAASQVVYTGPKPTQKMKPVHWEKVPNQLSSTSWWSTAPLADGSSNMIDALDISPNLVESLFASVQTDDDRKKAAKADAESKGLSTETTTPAVNEGIQLLQGARTQNLAITRNRLGLSIAQIRQVLFTCNIAPLNERQVDLLPLLLPDSEEEKALQAYLDGCGDPEKLREQEKFLVSVMNIPRIRHKISVTMCLMYMEQKIRETVDHVRIMEVACMQVENSKSLKALLKLTLKIGNFMNFGTNRMVDSSMGVRVRSIEQLGSVRSAGTLNDGTEAGASNAKSILHYMARLCAAQAPFVLKIKEELSVMEEASGIEHDAVAEQVNEMIVQTRHASRETEHEETKVCDETKQKVKQWCDQVTDVTEKFRAVEAHAANVLRLFGEDPAKTPYSDWFGLIGRVSVGFDKAATENSEEDEKRERRLRVDDAKRERQNLIEGRKNQEKKIMEEHQQRQLKKQLEKEQKIMEEKMSHDNVFQSLDEIGMAKVDNEQEPSVSKTEAKKKWTLRATLRLNKPASERQLEQQEAKSVSPVATPSIVAVDTPAKTSEPSKISHNPRPTAPVSKPPGLSVGQMPVLPPAETSPLVSSEPDFSDRGRAFRKTLSKRINMSDLMAEMAGTEVLKQLGLSGTGVAALKPGWSIQMAQSMGSQGPIAESLTPSASSVADSDDEDEV